MRLKVSARYFAAVDVIKVGIALDLIIRICMRPAFPIPMIMLAAGTWATGVVVTGTIVVGTTLTGIEVVDTVVAGTMVVGTAVKGTTFVNTVPRGTTVVDSPNGYNGNVYQGYGTVVTGITTAIRRKRVPWLWYSGNLYQGCGSVETCTRALVRL